MKAPEGGILRVIDANLNRSREALRVCEDIARFILDSPALSRDLKLVRHAISSIAKSMEQKKFRASRDSLGDVGRRSCAASEMKRRSIGEVFLANSQRAKESLRVLEEFFKLTDRNISRRLTHMRFRVYEIEKRASKKLSSSRYTRKEALV